MQLSLDTIQKVIESQDIHISKEEFNESFNAITSHVERGEYEEAIPLIKSSFDDNTFDIRLAMYYMYLHIHYGGIKKFHEQLPFLNTLITSHWEKLSPLPKRDQHAQKSLRWYFSRLIKAFEKVNHSCKNKDLKPLDAMTVGVTEEIIDAIKKDALTLNETLSKKWNNQSIGNNLLNVQKWATDLSQMSLSLNPQKKQPSKTTASETKASEKSKKPSQAPSQKKNPKEEKKSEVAEQPESYPYSIPLDALEPSQEMEQLYQKLQAFQLLIERGDYKKAAIIAEDIDKRLESFDPLAYFPKIFVQYFSQYAKHAPKIGQGQAEVNPLLQKLYNTDLDAFILW